MIRTLFLLFILSTFGTTAVLAQPDSTSSNSDLSKSTSSNSDSSKSRSFETIRISLAPTSTAVQSGLEAWSADYGILFNASTPYYKGRLHLDLSWTPWQAGPSSLPDFQTLSLLAGWSATSSNEFAVMIEGGMLLGNKFMLIDIDGVDGGRFESEIVAAPFVRLYRRIWSQSRVFVGVRAIRTFTRPRLDLVDVSLGIAVDVRAPHWIYGILK